MCMVVAGRDVRGVGYVSQLRGGSRVLMCSMVAWRVVTWLGREGGGGDVLGLAICRAAKVTKYYCILTRCDDFHD